MKILIVDDHPMLIEGVRRNLEMQPDISRIYEAGDGSQALNLMETQTFDVIILDLSLPGMSGWDVLKRIMQKWPQSKVIIYTMHPVELHGVRAIMEKAMSYITKDLPMSELLEAIRKVALGEIYLPPGMVNLMHNGVPKQEALPRHLLLSKREYEVMIMLADGQSYKEIAKNLNVDEKTISAHRSHIMEKMGLKKNPQLTRYCLEHHLI
jgi:two-component system, NarL family, invasion response regulator UvrY